MAGIGQTVAVFFPDVDEEIVRVHSADCTHITRDWKRHGAPVMLYAVSYMGIAKNLRKQGIRFKGIHVLPCAPLTEGFWSYTPEGEKLKLHVTQVTAKALTRKLKKLSDEDRSKFNKVTDVAPYLMERYGFTQVRK